MYVSDAPQQGAKYTTRDSSRTAALLRWAVWAALCLMRYPGVDTRAPEAGQPDDQTTRHAWTTHATTTLCLLSAPPGSGEGRGDVISLYVCM